MSTNVKIIGEHKQRRTFDTPDEFNRYYETHRSDIDNTTTNQLNKELCVVGYKIGRRHMQVVDGKRVGEIHLIPIRERCNASPGRVAVDTPPTETPDHTLTEQWEVIEGLASEVDRISAKMKHLETSLSQVLAIIDN